MLKNILNVNGVQQLGKNEQKTIHGGTNNFSCAQAISFDGTLCLCSGWIPQNGVCVNGDF